MLEFKVLGPLRVLVDGHDVPIPDPADRAVLARLLVHANRPTPVEHRVSPWLRGLIDALPGDTRLHVTAEPVLEVDVGLIDRTRAESLLAEAGTQPADRRRELLREATALWEVLPGGPPAVAEPALVELRLAVLAAWYDAELADTDASTLVPVLVTELATLPAAHRERFLTRLRDPGELRAALDAEVPVDDWDDDEPWARSVRDATKTVPVSVFLSDETAHGVVEAAIDGALADAGLIVIDRDDPVVGPWFRRWRAAELTAIAVQAAGARLPFDQDVASPLSEHVDPVLVALQHTREAVVRMGAVLIVKVDGQAVVHLLTAAQQQRLDRGPHLALSPREVVAELS